MGIFQKKVKISNNKNPNLFFEEDFWVDTGSLFTFIPEDSLEAIKFEPTSTKNLTYADGRTENRLFGFCNFEIEGLDENNICPVIFAPKNSLFLLGASALEIFCVAADPVNKKLVPISAIIAGFYSDK